MSGDLTLYSPGTEVPATLVAGSGGSVASRGDGLEISGENASNPEVRGNTSVDGFIATLVDLPPNYDDSQTHSAGDTIGEVTVRVTHYVEWLNDGSGGTLTAGDKVVHDGSGVIAADLDGTSPAHTADDVVGMVWATNNRDEGTDGKVAVVRYGR